MMNKIYGNSFALQTFSSMFKSGRIPHAFLIFGEKGLGKKTLANYLAAALLCEKSEGRPCGECHSCKIAEKKSHPDIIYPEQSGKLNTYTVETCRQVCADSFVAPNNGEKKVYIFSDADNIQLPAQNALLKIIEEPPAPVYFIFTAQTKDAFLPTIISRVTSIGASVCSENECTAALAMMDYESDKIAGAVEAFGGNIGMCIQYIENTQFQSVIALTNKAVDSIISRDEYGLLTVFFDSLLKDKTMALSFLKMLDLTVRDSLVIRYNENSPMAGCYKKGALKLSEKISARSVAEIHKHLNQAAADIKANVSTVLLMSALCGEIIDS
ncbi:MAG: DNA polymerase III subunit delta' [Ruminococcus sp.]|nr:DNA polymerase III subunit delta' [Ruminococcus sp.]